MFNNSSLSQTATTVVFIDASVSDYQTLQTGVVEGVETVMLSQNQNGIEEITDFLRQHPQITTIHIVSHGSPGCLYLGNSQLNLENISKYAELLQHWQSQSILLYGCNVAAGDAGEEFIRKLHEITNATISASATKTGNAALGGNWELEVNIPENHRTSLVFRADTLNTYQGVFAPTLVGKWDFLSNANAVTVVGNYAYAVGDTLEIIDISNPNNPVFKGNYDVAYGRDVQIVGNYAYVADDRFGLQIIDISNPLTPTLKGNYNTTGYAWSVQLVGNYAYVADGYSGLQIIDISNPLTPTLKGNYATSGFAYDVQVVGNYAYVADYNSGLQIIDISNPLRPTLKGNYNTTGYAYGVQLVGNYAYVADGSSGLQIIDISNPLTPTLKGNYDTSGEARSVQLVGNYAYVTDGSSGLQIIDISNPLTPTLKGNYNTTSYAYGVQLIGSYAYVAAGSSGLQIIDISNPLTPTLKGNYDPSGDAKFVQVVGNYAYVADNAKGLQIIDISNPLTPTLKGNYTGNAYGVQVVGNYAYVANYATGLQIIDISNPSTPTFKGNCSNIGYAEGVQVVGNYAYVTAGSLGLQIIDISNPLTPTLKGNYNTPGYATGVQVVGNYGYVADGSSGLQIIDISNPLTPTLKGNYDTPGNAYGVQVVGNYAYVADYYSGLQIIDISNPLTPTLKGNYSNNTYGFAYAVQVVGNYAYVGVNGGERQIIDISNPSTPTLKVNYPTDTSGTAWSVQVVGNYAYIAANSGGLKIIDVSEFTSLYTAIESAGNTKLVKDTTNKYFTQTGTNTPIAIKNGGQQIYKNIYSGWQTLAAETVNGDNQVLWKNTVGNFLLIWHLDSNWNLVSGEGNWALNSADAFIQETKFGIDTNGDGIIGNPYTAIESAGNTKLVKDSTNKYFTQIGTNTPIAIKNGGQQIYQDIYAGWQTLAAETVNGDNQVLWKNTAGNFLLIWHLDSNWNLVSGEGNWALNSADAFTQETKFGIDTNGDGIIGNPYTAIELAGNTKLVKDSTNKYFTQVGTNTPIAIKNGGQQIYQDIYAGWQTLAAETINGDNQVLWKNTAGTGVLIWHLDNNWNLVSGEGNWALNSAEALTQETKFGIDANGDGVIGYTPIELAGNTKLIKDAANKYFTQIGANTPIAIKNGGQQIYQDIYAGWQTLAAETVNGDNQVLWKNTAGNFLLIWHLDSNWNLVSGEGNWALNSADALTQETNFGIDANGDGKIGYAIIEANGNTTFLKDAANKHFAQIGTNTPIAIKNAGQQIYQDIYGSDWQTLAVETINGDNQVLWKNTAGNFLLIWHLDSNWNWVYSEGQYALSSADALAKETVFGIDANSDGKIGNPSSLTLTGTSGNDILIGGANSDTFNGGLGNDILYLGLNDNAVDNVNYASGGGADTVYQFVRGVGGDKLNFSGIYSLAIIQIKRWRGLGCLQ